jgi:hypothetical protein
MTDDETLDRARGWVFERGYVMGDPQKVPGDGDWYIPAFPKPSQVSARVGSAPYGAGPTVAAAVSNLQAAVGSQGTHR